VPTQVLERVQRTRKDWAPTEIPHETPVSRYSVAAYLEDLPACGYRVYTACLLPGLPPQQPSLARVAGLANELLELVLDGETGLRCTPRGGETEFAGLHFFRDGGDVGDQYNYMKPLGDHTVETIGACSDIRHRRSGAVLSELEIALRPQVPAACTADRQGRSTDAVELPIRSRVRLTHGSPLVEITTTVENTARDHRLRVVFPLGAPVASALADTSFGALERPVEKPAWWPYESRDRPQRSFVNLRAPGRGLALLTRGLYEHDVRPNGELELTLLRCVGYMFCDPATLHAWDAVEGGQCMGERSFHYALLPHDGTLSVADLTEAASRFQAPLRGWQVAQQAGAHGAEHSFLRLEPACLQLSALKWAEDRESLIVRCYNASDTTVCGELHLPGPWQAAYRVNLDEQREAELPRGENGILAVEARPWEVVTVELVPAHAS